MPVHPGSGSGFGEGVPAQLCAELQPLFRWRTADPFLVRLAQGKVGLTL